MRIKKWDRLERRVRETYFAVNLTWMVIEHLSTDSHGLLDGSPYRVSSHSEAPIWPTPLVEENMLQYSIPDR
jgi:hypothetical protein